MDVGSVMVIKLVINEFVVMIELVNGYFYFIECIIVIIFVFFVLFVNFFFIGIIFGVMKGLNEEKGNFVVKYGLKILLIVILVSFLSVIVIGLLV